MHIETHWHSYKVVSKFAGLKWKYRVVKHFSQNKILTCMVVGQMKPPTWAKWEKGKRKASAIH
jgi:predicted urease superfamily metal-dependent hydrolase